MSVNSSVSHSLNEAPIPYNELLLNCRPSIVAHPPAVPMGREWLSFGWPLRRCQMTLVHTDLQVAARSVGCIRCVRDWDVGMWKRG